MKILSVQIENLNSLKLKKTISFSEGPLSNTGLFAITGDTGAGKTTVLDAITLALYGRVHRNKEVTEVMSYGATESLAEVEFESAKGLYRAKWSTYRSHKKIEGKIQAPKRELAKWDQKKEDFLIIAEKIREVDQLVEEVSGLDYDRFTRSVLLSQGDFAAFLQAGERERSDLLERITGTEIYTRISAAAYERYKAEQNKLDDLRKQQEALQLLSTEEIENIKAELADRQQKAGDLRKELDPLRAQIPGHQQKQELEHKRLELQSKSATLQVKQEAFQEDEARLKAHGLAQPHSSLLEKSEETAVRLQEVEGELAQLEQDLLQRQTELESLGEKSAIEKEALLELQQKRKKRLPVYDRVLALDEQMKARSESFQRVQQEAEGLQQELDIQNKQKSDLQNQIEKRETKLTEFDQWMQQHRDRAELGVLLPEVDRKRADMRLIIQEQKQLEAELATARKQEADLKTETAALNEKLVSARAQLDQLDHEFKQDLPPAYATNRNELLRVLHQDIETLGERQQQLQELQRINAEYQDSLVLLVEYETQIEGLNSQEMAIDKEVISAMDTLDQAQEQLEFKQHIFEQQQLIANYEKDRHQLKEGDPCPLCQSTHHPFRVHKVKPFVDKARKDYEKSKKIYERVLKEKNLLLNQQKELKIQKEQLQGDERQELGGQLARQNKRIELLEEQLAGTIRGLGKGTHEQDRGPALILRIAETEKDMAQKKKTRDRLVKISEQLDEREAVVQSLEAQLLERNNRLQVLEERILLNNGQLTKIQQQNEALLIEVGAIFKQFGQSFDAATAKEVYQSLKKDFEDYTQQGELQTQEQQQLALDRQEIKQLEQQLKKAQERYQKLKTRLEAEETSLAALQKERTDLLGDKDPTQEKEKLESALETKANRVDALKEETHQVNVLLKSLASLVQTNKKEQQKRQKQWDAWQVDLEKAALNAGFSDRSALSAALLPEVEVERLSAQSNELERETLSIEQSLKDLEKSLQKLLQIAIPETPLVDLQGHLGIRELDYQGLQQALGGFTERLAANEKQRKAAGKLIKQIEAQEKEFTRWAQLNEIIGQADGKKFRIFAQGLTLSKLIELANYHLELLNGRYLIRRRSDENLELEIIDTFQADNARSMNTLSGGESFLVSLALALGLSDLAGRDARIQSLFIDEGFGTLDETSLDMAIDTLENLQSDGKMIGIISHVKALKERIGTQIQVTKHGTGFSEIVIVG